MTQRRLEALILLTSYFSWIKCITWVGSQDMYWFCLNFLFVFFPCWLVGFRIFIWRKTEKNITMALFIVQFFNFLSNDWTERMGSSLNKCRFWSIKNSSDVIEKLRLRNFQGSQVLVSSFDFSTLYTSLPHQSNSVVSGQLVFQQRVKILPLYFT